VKVRVDVVRTQHIILRRRNGNKPSYHELSMEFIDGTVTQANHRTVTAMLNITSGTVLYRTVAGCCEHGNEHSFSIEKHGMC
jgi:hypothetical protein